MINKKLIVEMLKDSDINRRYCAEMYYLANTDEKDNYHHSYLAAFADFEARTQMLLGFGYTIERDENGEITGITNVK